MPLVIQFRARRAIHRITALTCFALLASTGAAFAACPAQPVATPFLQWSDANGYFLVPGGSFEGSSDDVGWRLDNASLTSGNEPFQVNSSDDSQSLRIDSGGSATSPYFCVDNTMSSLRFFAQQLDGGSDLRVDALVQRRYRVAVVPLADLADGSTPEWAPTDPIDGGAGALPDTRMISVALRFTAPSETGSWQIDDVYVDPYRSG
ncbi:MAG: hypothetical protein ACXVFQ_24530 [Solirubrobacteraceae bacterium]